MSRISVEDQFAFLVSCIKHSNQGKVDFTLVASECGIVTKGAAAKRYERIIKGNGISGNGDNDNSPGSATQTPKKGAAPKPKTPKTPKTPKAPKTPKGGKAADTTTPTKRKAANANGGTKKKFKSKEKVNDSESENGQDIKVESPKGAMATGSPLRLGSQDPFMPQVVGAAVTEDDVLFREFCNTGKAAKQAEAEDDDSNEGADSQDILGMDDEVA
ncbi:hypothetical protein FQN57_003321 [Myotisia sp. PD_48]|nr:hypothetical protein FQN57_003321 [Myotisia sp. PD_48]